LGTGKGVSINGLYAILKRIVAGFGLDVPEVQFVEEREGDILHSIADVSGLETLIDLTSFTKLEEGLRDLVRRTLDEAEA